MSITITVGGVNVDDIVDVDYTTDSGRGIGQANITLANTASNRAVIESGEDVVIRRNGSKVWSGEVAGNPSNASGRQLTFEVEAEQKTGQLDFAKVSRPFIERTSSEMIREAIAERRDPTIDDRFITNGTNPGNWNSNADNAESLDVSNDMANEPFNSPEGMYFDWLSGRQDTFDMTYKTASQSELPPRRLDSMRLRILIASAGGVFDGFVVARDYDGISYRWGISTTGGEGFDEIVLPVEDADVNVNGEEFDYNNEPSLTFDTGYSPPDLTAGTFRIYLTTDKPLQRPRGVAVDWVKSLPFDTVKRNLGVSTDIDPTTYIETRRIEGTLLDMVNRFKSIDDAKPYITENDVFKYKTGGANPTGVVIDENAATPQVVDFDIDRDFDVRNRVIIQGRGDLQAAFEDPASIQFYNEEAAKPSPIDDPSIRTREQAKRRARGFLNENAWDDAAMSITGVGAEISDREPDDLVEVKWPSESIDGTFVVTSTGRTSEGYDTISLSGTVSI